jgi:DNA-directed RNA polymerase specialized sigma subunit
LDAVLKELDAPMRAASRKYAGGDDAITIGHAKRIVADSLERYDPSKAAISTYVDRQLQGLQRWSSRRKRVLKTPDRVQVEAARLGQAERRLEQELGVPPSMRQLSDETGMPLDRIRRIRSAEQQIFVGSSQGGSDEGGLGTIEDSPVADDQKKTDAWIKFVRDDLNPVDQYVLEHTLGLDGAKILSNQVMAAKLKITPGALSQRKARIQAILDKQETASPFG